MISLFKDYIGKQIEILKLDTAEKGVLVSSKIAFVLLISFLTILFLSFFSVGIALLLGHFLRNYAYGFLSLGGFYLLLIFCGLIFQKEIKNYVVNKLLSMLKNNNNE